MIALTGNRYYKIHGVRVQMSAAAARKRLHLGRAIVLGKNAWYFVVRKQDTWIIKIQHGKVSEIGITRHWVAHTRAQERYLLRHL